LLKEIILGLSLPTDVATGSSNYRAEPLYKADLHESLNIQILFAPLPGSGLSWNNSFYNSETIFAKVSNFIIIIKSWEAYSEILSTKWMMSVFSI
jgi:hypothetical protein